MNLRKKLIGDKAFYRMVFAVAIPIIIQSAITNFVSLLDNIMVGQVGTEQMSGVAVANQLFFVFNLCIFGALAGAGIFGAQFYGSGNMEGVRNAFRFKLWISVIILVAAFGVFLTYGDSLMSLFLNDTGDGSEAARTLGYAHNYMLVMIWGLIPFALSQCYGSTLRESGETRVPMIAGITAVFVNLVFNYILIFGKFGAPELGVVGAAVATVLSRYVECAIVIIWPHRNPDKAPYMAGVYKTMKIPAYLVKQIIIKGSPLMVNEVLWSIGMSTMTQCYSLRGLSVIAGLNIASTITNMFNIVFMSMGNVVSIIVGQLLGAGKMEEARDTDTKLIAFAVGSCLVICSVMAVTAPLFPLMYNTSETVRDLATSFIRISALAMPLHAFMHCCYFTLRTGGKTVITFIFDSVFLWCVSIPLAFVLSRYTDMPIEPLYLACQMIEILKCILGFILVKKGIWLQNFVAEHNN